MGLRQLALYFFLVLTDLATATPLSLFRPCDELLAVVQGSGNANPTLRGQRNGKSVTVAPQPRPVRRISLVIPTYHELDNGNVMRILQTARRQTLPHHLLELVFVVNNSPAIAGNPNHPILIENLKTLALLKNIKADFRIRVLDLATQGIETNMGILRQKGSELAIRESGLPAEQHVVMHMDADTVFQDDFLQRLYDLYAHYPFDAVLVQRYHTLAPDIDDFTLKTFYKFKQDDTEYKLSQALSYARFGVATPQISSRASAFVVAQGFPPIRQDEDFRFTTRLSESALYYYSPDLKVTAQDRVRPDGFDARIRHLWNLFFREHSDYLTQTENKALLWDLTYYGQAVTLANKIKNHRLSAYDAVESYAKVISKILGRPANVNADALEAFAEWATYYRAAWSDSDLVFSNPLFSETSQTTPGQTLIVWLENLASPAERNQLRNRFWPEVDSHNKSVIARRTSIQSLLHGNTAALKKDCFENSHDIFIQVLCRPKSALHDRVRQLANHGLSLQPALQTLELEYPDWLLPMMQTPNKLNMLSYRLAAELLVAAHNQPELYPAFSKLYEELRH
ncbi:MAG: hypothetical protein AB7N80_15720 [Bdellovibrionales bacterium]